MQSITRILLVMTCGVLVARGAEGDALEISEVGTFGDLAKQPAIELGDGVVIRVGIQAKTIPLGSALAFYCLTEGYVPERQWGEDGRVGPVRVVVTRPGLVEAKSKFLAERAVLDKEPRGKLVFVEEVSMSGPEPRVLRVLTRKGKVLAQTTLRAAKKSAHPWLTLGQGKKLQKLTKLAPGDPHDLAVGMFAPRSIGWAVPDVDAMSPIVFEGSPMAKS
jgi:hypothetical protein